MIYADHAATTKISETAKLAMLSAMEKDWYNPSSLYTPGQQASGTLMDARVRIARCLGCLPKEIYFTSGGSEADNQAILSAAAIGKRQGKMHIISTAFEHHAVLHTLKKLEKEGLYTMGDIAKCSQGAENEYYNEKLLYDLFGVNAELLIDHAWGYESCTMKDIKNYKPERNSIGTGQVLSRPYNFEKTKLIVKEMLDLLALDLVEKGLVTNQIVLTIGYDKDNEYHGEMMIDRYNRKIPKHAHGTINLERYTSSSKLIIKEVIKKFDEIVNRNLLVKRINISASNVLYEDKVKDMIYHQQLNLFTNHQNINQKYEKEALEKEKNLQKATLKIKQKYGKNAILKGMNLEEGATTRERNEIIGGHKA